LVAQYTTRLLIPEVEQRIDDIRFENYNIPLLQHGERLLKNVDRDVAVGGVHEFTEADYVDEREQQTYVEPDDEFNVGLTTEQIQTLVTLNTYLRTLVDGENVSDKKVKAVLTAEQYRRYEESLTEITHSNEIKFADRMPSDLTSYIDKLKLADFEYNKYEKMAALKRVGRKRNQSGTTSKQYNKSEHLYERAIERLQEIWETAIPAEQFELQNWLDREIDFDAGADSKIGITANTVPRVRGSKSKHALDSGLPKLSKRLKRKECQLKALRSAAWELTFKPEPVVEETEEERKETETKLQRLLKSVYGDDEDY